MTALDLLLSVALAWLVIGLALCATDLLFTPRDELAALWRFARQDAGLPLALFALAVGTVITFARWSVLWPRHVRSLFNRRRL